MHGKHLLIKHNKSCIVLTALLHTATMTKEKYSQSIHYSEHRDSVANVTAFLEVYEAS